MFQTAYTGIVPLQKNQHYKGGFCKFWYVPVEDVQVFPRVNSVNQQLVASPSLLEGKSWFGPVYVPRDKLGFTEELKRTDAGPYWEKKLQALHIGDSPETRVNLENMVYHRYLVVGKLRAGGTYLLLGTIDSPLTLNLSTTSGLGAVETAQTALEFFVETIHKALVIPEFSGDITAPGNSGGSPGGGDENMPNQKEVIHFNNVTQVAIPWTPARLNKFGIHPVIEVFTKEVGEPPVRFTGGSIETDQPPPAFTELVIKMGANTSGYIVIT